MQHNAPTDLDSQALEDAQTAQDGDVVGRQAEGELVHHVAQLAHHALEVKLAHGSVEHIREGILEAITTYTQKK